MACTFRSISGKLKSFKVSLNGISRNITYIGGGETWRNKDDVKPEIDEELQKARMKDMPVAEMKNPYEREKVKCILCHYNIVPEYKNVKLLSQFVSPYTGKVYGRHITRLCKAQQERVEREIAKSQSAGLMAYYFRDPIFSSDPKLFDPERPIRPHRF